MWPFNKRNIAFGDVRPNNENAKNKAARYGLTGKHFVRILYSQHFYYNDSDFVAQVLSEIIDDWKIYDKVNLDITDGGGNYEEKIHGEIANKKCKVIIIFAKDSFEMSSLPSQPSHYNFYKEMIKCVKLLKEAKEEQKEDDRFFPIYIVESEENGIRKIQDAIIEDLKNTLSEMSNENNKQDLKEDLKETLSIMIDEYKLQNIEDLKNTLFKLNSLTAKKPRCTDITRSRHRETYMKSLENGLEDIQFKQL